MPGWFSQLNKCPTLGFDSGHDFMVREFLDSVQSLGILSFCVSAPPLLMLALSQNK